MKKNKIIHLLLFVMPITLPFIVFLNESKIKYMQSHANDFTVIYWFLPFFLYLVYLFIVLFFKRKMTTTIAIVSICEIIIIVIVLLSMYNTCFFNQLDVNVAMIISLVSVYIYTLIDNRRYNVTS